MLINPYLEQVENDDINEFLSKGYLIRNIEDNDEFDKICKLVESEILKNISSDFNNNQDILNNFHNIINNDLLNSVRLKIIEEINSKLWLRISYYKIFRRYLELLIGNELSMQNSINLSIQCPNDNSSLLPVHADVWSGDSPFEIVCWLPLVDCYDTKSMYILPPNESSMLESNFSDFINQSSSDIFESIRTKVEWINIKKGQLLIFNQNLPHGNVVNNEHETRFSFNCRFKNIFSPYANKKNGSFFEPITLKPITKIGINYKLPDVI